MKNLFIKNKALQVILLCLAIVSIASVAGRIAFAKGPSLKQQAIKELPSVIEEIEYTDPFVERNAKAKERKTQLLQCIDGGDCSFLAGTPQA